MPEQGFGIDDVIDIMGMVISVLEFFNSWNEKKKDVNDVFLNEFLRIKFVKKPNMQFSRRQSHRVHHRRVRAT